MAAIPYIKVSGTWNRVWHIYIKVSGTWREVKEGWIKVGGVWQQIFNLFTPYTDRVDGAASPIDGQTTGIITVPVNARHAKVTLVGHGGPSWFASTGGGGGGASVYDIDLVTADAGKTISYSVSNKRHTSPTVANSTASCSFTNGTMSLTSVGGNPYDTTFGDSRDRHGEGGAASGGNTSNTTGGAGTLSAGGASGAGDAGSSANTDGTHGAGAGPTPGGTSDGGAGYIKVDWT